MNVMLNKHLSYFSQGTLLKIETLCVQLLEETILYKGPFEEWFPVGEDLNVVTDEIHDLNGLDQQLLGRLTGSIRILEE